MNPVTNLLAKWLILPALLSGLGGPVQEAQPVQVPILMYHHVTQDGSGEMSVSEACFLEHLDGLQAAGFQTVSLWDLYAYVYYGTPLPEKPVVITFDDGYESNYTFVYPALLERDMEAAIFVIGSTVGCSADPETGSPIYSHFDYDAAYEMTRSGAVSIQSHTYDLHHRGDRQGVGRIEGEALPAYEKLLREDLAESMGTIQDCTGQRMLALAYPYGISSQEAERVCNDLHIPITVTTREGFAELRQGDPASLRLLNRFSVDDCPVEALIARITPS